MDIQTKDARAEILANRVRDTAMKIMQAVPPIEPGPAYWLESDSCESYCWQHAIKARETEFGFGPLLDPEKPAYRNTDLEEAFFHGIGATHNGESDSTECCTTCGATLSYVLTDYGFRDELGFWLENPSEATTPEDSFALYHLILNVGHWTKRRDLLDCLIVLKRALRTVPRGNKQ